MSVSRDESTRSKIVSSEQPLEHSTISRFLKIRSQNEQTVHFYFNDTRKSSLWPRLTFLDRV